jgi:linalool 8-monooxygenase
LEVTEIRQHPFTIDAAPGQRAPLKSRKAAPVGPEIGIDLKSPDLYKHARHFAAFRRLRREAPVYWNAESDSTGFWAVTRYEDMMAVLQDPETFSPAMEHGGIRIFNIQDVSTEPPLPHIFAMVPPAHTEMRKSLAPALSSDRVAELEAFVRSKARSLISAIAARGHADYANAVANPLVMSVLTRVLGVPEDDGPTLQRWSETLVGDDDPEYQASEANRRNCVQEIDDYARALLAERRRQPANDLASCLAKAIARDESEDAHFSINFMALLLAGNETTRHSLANAIWAFSVYPEQKAKLLADKRLIKSAVKEVVRWTTPLLHIRRTATRDVVLGGLQIRSGDKVVAWYASANRDESLWDNPDDFDIERFARDGGASHIAFGVGAHHCLGWRIAELELAVALEETFSALPDIVARGAVDRLRSNLIYGVKRLPVMFSSRTIEP